MNELFVPMVTQRPFTVILALSSVLPEIVTAFDSPVMVLLSSGDESSNIGAVFLISVVTSLDNSLLFPAESLSCTLNEFVPSFTVTFSIEKNS